jgi:glutamyl-tRNA(Gln) amidotransferase subunit E
MGETDPAALFEFTRGRLYYYEYYNDTTCLVEADEEPPHEIDAESVDICLIVAALLGSTTVDEIHPMRKIVIDGSNTTGFQRTAVVATGGRIEVEGKEIQIQTISVEEDAARKTGEDELKNTKTYKLDRLGIPLIEVATAPDITSPNQAQDVALKLGLLLRSTGMVKRGLGTIRQDVNVSIPSGAIIEIKGLQQLEMLGKTVEMEVLRQTRLLQVRDALVARGIQQNHIPDDVHDVSGVFAKSESKLIKKTLSSGGVVYAIRLPGFAGLLGFEIQPDRRLGTELSDHAKFWGGVGGIFHTDELPKYGISEEEVRNLRTAVAVSATDAVVIVAADKDSSTNALNAVISRSRAAIQGVPAETRVPLPDGTTKYARPRPGEKRMYPETDVRPMRISEAHLRAIRKKIPEPLEVKEKRFIEQYGLSNELASQIVRSVNIRIFEQVMKTIKISATLVVVTLENTLVSLNRNGVHTENLRDSDILHLFETVSRGEASSDAIPEIIRHLAANSNSTIEEAIKATGMTTVSSDDIQRTVERIVQERVDYVKAQGDRASGGLMGVVMKELKGKADGKTVKMLLDAEVARVLAQSKE